jgi:NTE family protein
MMNRGRHSHDQYMRPFVHRIDGADEVAMFSASSKFDTRWSFLTHLRDIGRAAAHNWMKAHYDSIGVEGTLDLGIAFHKAGLPGAK